MFFGLKNFYSIQKNECKEYVTCAEPERLDESINKCVDQTGSVVSNATTTPLAQTTETQTAKKDCGTNANYNE
jgi:hypothetical protein